MSRVRGVQVLFFYASDIKIKWNKKNNFKNVMSQQWKVATTINVSSLINSLNIHFGQRVETAETMCELRLLD